MYIAICGKWKFNKVKKKSFHLSQMFTNNMLDED